MRAVVCLVTFLVVVVAAALAVAVAVAIPLAVPVRIVVAAVVDAVRVVHEAQEAQRLLAVPRRVTVVGGALQRLPDAPGAPALVGEAAVAVEPTAREGSRG